MLHNPDVYPEPHSFKPERYFKDGKLDDEVSTSQIVYGFGRFVFFFFYVAILSQLIVFYYCLGAPVPAVSPQMLQSGWRWSRSCPP
jgi:hypothetical protein